MALHHWHEFINRLEEKRQKYVPPVQEVDMHWTEFMFQTAIKRKSYNSHESCFPHPAVSLPIPSHTRVGKGCCWWRSQRTPPPFRWIHAGWSQRSKVNELISKMETNRTKEESTMSCVVFCCIFIFSQLFSTWKCPQRTFNLPKIAHWKHWTPEKILKPKDAACLKHKPVPSCCRIVFGVCPIPQSPQPGQSSPVWKSQTTSFRLKQKKFKSCEGI